MGTSVAADVSLRHASANDRGTGRSSLVAMCRGSNKPTNERP